MQEINYYFDQTKENHPFIFELEANRNSFPPANALRIAPQFKDGYHPCEKNGEWIQVKDYRNTDVYSKKTGEKIIINNVGNLHEELTTIIPDCEYPIFDETSQKFIIDESRSVIYIPQLLSRFQALTILKLTKLKDGITLYKAIDEYINTLSDDIVDDVTAKTAWSVSQEFRRDSVFIQLVQSRFKLTDEAIDDIFIKGSKITA